MAIGQLLMSSANSCQFSSQTVHSDKPHQFHLFWNLPWGLYSTVTLYEPNILGVSLLGLVGL